MKNKSHIHIGFLCLLFLTGIGQNSVFSPYSRYGIGELSQSTFAHNTAMGGAFIAHKPDSTMPIFINAGNPAAYALIRLTSLEVGGSFLYSSFKGNNNSALNKWGTNFSYAALGFPMGGNGGACFGIMPYSQVGYDTESKSEVAGVGTVTYRFNGTGGLNKAFIGYGIMPFNKRLVKFRTKNIYAPDSLRHLKGFGFKAGHFGSKLLSDLSIGANVNYIFGNIQNVTRVIYPGSLLYSNTFRDRNVTLGDFTGNFGVQTALTVDSIKDPKKRVAKIRQDSIALREMNVFSEEVFATKYDSLKQFTPSYKRAIKERVKFTFGYFANINNDLKVKYSSSAYNYILNGFGDEIVRDTAYRTSDVRSTITLPLEQGFGVGFKKGEKLNIVADFAITDWSSFRYLENATDLIKNYRVAAGVDFVPEKYAAGRGAFARRVHYRLGVSYQTGYIQIQNTAISNYFVSAGVGLPVGIGRLSSMVNITAQYGKTGSSNAALLKENYWRINFGFTFSDKWFQKYRYD